MELLLIAGIGLSIAAGSEAADSDWFSAIGLVVAGAMLNAIGLEAIFGAAH